MDRWKREGWNLTIAILTPYLQPPDMRWAQALQELHKPPGTKVAALANFPLDQTRQKLVEWAIAQQAESVFFLDSDVILEPQDLQRLMALQSDLMIRGEGGEAVVGVYATHLPTDPAKPRPCVGADEGDRLAPLPWREGGIEPCDLAGLGCALIHRSVFERLRKPWFRLNPSGGGEDSFFWRKAREIGVRPVVCWDVQPLHIKTLGIKADGSIVPL